MGGAIIFWTGLRKWGLSSAKTDPQSLSYVIESLYTQMARKNEADPYGSGELKNRIAEILWQRTYAQKCLSHYSELFKDTTKDTTALAKAFVGSPLAFYK